MLIGFTRGLIPAVAVVVFVAGCSPSINEKEKVIASTAAVCQQGTATAPASAAEVLSGKEFWDSTGAKLSGTMAVGTNVNGADGSASFLISQGYYDGTKTCNVSDSDLIQTNIVNGVTILGITGTANLETHSACVSGNQTGCVSSGSFPTQSTPATPPAAGDVLSGKQYYAGGAVQTGTMTNRGTFDATASFPGAGYYNGAVSNLPNAADIVFGKTILGVAGSAAGADPQVLFYFDAESKSATPNKGNGVITYGASVAAVSGIGMQENSLFFSVGWDWMTVPTSNIDPTIGTMGFYFRKGNNDPGSYVHNGTPDTGPYFAFLNAFGTDELSFRYKNSDTTFTVSNNVTVFVELAWNHPGNSLAWRVNGGSWSETTGLSGAAPTIPNLVIGPNDGSAPPTYFDQLIVANVYKKDLYSVRHKTDF